jgi:hypothetical protein
LFIHLRFTGFTLGNLCLNKNGGKAFFLGLTKAHKKQAKSKPIEQPHGNFLLDSKDKPLFPKVKNMVANLAASISH